MPHRRLPDDQTWQIDTDRVGLMVEPGRRRDRVSNTYVPVGVPYGSRARLIMLYLQTEALRTGSRDIELGRSMTEWLGRMGIPNGGKSQRDVRDQANRIARCRFTFHLSIAGGGEGLVNQNIMDTAMFAPTEDFVGGSLFVEVARLSEMFFDQLQKHPIPVEEAAVRALSNNSAALDIYAWLAYRLYVLKKPTPITWAALKAQFGPGVNRMTTFRAGLSDSLKLALAVYRDAKVEIEERGLLLHPSPPPVPPRHAGLGKPAVLSFPSQERRRNPRLGCR